MIEVYTDGSSLGNPGKSGWAFLVNNNGIISSRSGFSHKSTNNQMEITAAIKAIEYLNKYEEMTIYTDSNYVKNGITLWIKNWRKNNWINSSRKKVKNQDLWEKLDQLNSVKKIDWKWIKSHDKNKFNNEVDLLARQSAENLTESSFN